jgi:hypothetical protein
MINNERSRDNIMNLIEKNTGILKIKSTKLMKSNCMELINRKINENNS